MVRFLPLLGLLLMGASAPPAVSLELPSFVSSKSDVTVRVDVLKHPDNRVLVLLWDGPVSGSDERPHEGMGAPSRLVFDKHLRGLPDGVYTLQAIVLRQNAEGEWSEVRSTPKTLQVGQAPLDDLEQEDF